MWGTNVTYHGYIDPETQRVTYAIYLAGTRVATEHKRRAARLAAAKLVPPDPNRPGNPRIHVYGSDGVELGVTHAYRNILHAVAHEPSGCTFVKE
jgi:hypothetical protein